MTSGVFVEADYLNTVGIVTYFCKMFTAFGKNVLLKNFLQIYSMHFPNSTLSSLLALHRPHPDLMTSNPSKTLKTVYNVQKKNYNHPQNKIKHLSTKKMNQNETAIEFFFQTLNFNDILN